MILVRLEGRVTKVSLVLLAQRVIPESLGRRGKGDPGAKGDPGLPGSKGRRVMLAFQVRRATKAFPAHKAPWNSRRQKEIKVIRARRAHLE